MKLELKHLAPYLPYEVKVKFELKNNSDYIPNGTKDYEYKGICILHQSDFDWISEFKIYKPILRPLSDLTKEIEVDGEKFVPIENYNYLRFEEISNYNGGQNVLNFIQVREHNLLLEMHFDVFGLIEQGLAIDVNTL